MVRLLVSKTKTKNICIDRSCWGTSLPFVFHALLQVDSLYDKIYLSFEWWAYADPGNHVLLFVFFVMMRHLSFLFSLFHKLFDFTLQENEGARAASVWSWYIVLHLRPHEVLTFVHAHPHAPEIHIHKRWHTHRRYLHHLHHVSPHQPILIIRNYRRAFCKDRTSKNFTRKWNWSVLYVISSWTMLWNSQLLLC